MLISSSQGYQLLHYNRDTLLVSFIALFLHESYIVAEFVNFETTVIKTFELTIVTRIFW
jgi:hypothetical protein